MKRVICLLFVGLSGISPAASLVAVVTELERSHEVHTVHIDVTARSTALVRQAPERRIADFQKYVAKKDRHFWAGARQFGRADEVLAQTSVGDSDILIVRREHTAFLNPLKLFVALSGHPIQVSEIWVVVIADEKEIWSKKLVSRDSIYRWSAQFFE